VKKSLNLFSRILLCSFLAALAVVSAASGKDPAQETQTAKPPSTKAKVKTKPQPPCPKEANERRVRATVVLRAIFSSTGEVTNINVAAVRPSDLPDDLVRQLSEESMKAAAKIKFEPATKDGHPASMYMQLEYHFTCS
jgi:TonB family protein